MDLSLDFNHELYPLRKGQNITLVLATTLSLSAGSAADVGGESWRPDTSSKARGLDADYEYVMHGKVSYFIYLSFSVLNFFVDL